jgi:hypothetical protein
MIKESLLIRKMQCKMKIIFVNDEFDCIYSFSDMAGVLNSELRVRPTHHYLLLLPFGNQNMPIQLTDELEMKK